MTTDTRNPSDEYLARVSASVAEYLERVRLSAAEYQERIKHAQP